MPIRAIVFDTGGVLEVTPSGVEPTVAFPAMIARWEERLHLRPGELDARLRRLDERLKRHGQGWRAWHLFRGGMGDGAAARDGDGRGTARREVCVPTVTLGRRHPHPAGIAHVW